MTAPTEGMDYLAPKRGHRLDGKRVLITGTGGGQGAAAQALFCLQGATVQGCDIAPGAAEERAAALRKLGLAAYGSTVDLSKPDATRSWVETAAEELGGVDVLYNNAAKPVFAPFGELTLEQWRFTIVNELEIVYLVTSRAWPYLADGGGSIVNTASIAATSGMGEVPTAAHAAAKGGVLGLTKQLAAEGAPLGIRANAISPGFVDSPGSAVIPPDIREWMMGAQLIKRTGQPMDIAWCALFLASDESAYVTGAEYVVDGGLSAGKAAASKA